MPAPSSRHTAPGAVFSGDARNYEVRVASPSKGAIVVTVRARGIVAAHNIALRDLQEHGITDIVFVKSVTLLDPESD